MRKNFTLVIKDPEITGDEGRHSKTVWACPNEVKAMIAKAE